MFEVKLLQNIILKGNLQKVSKSLIKYNIIKSFFKDKLACQQYKTIYTKVYYKYLVNFPI